MLDIAGLTAILPTLPLQPLQGTLFRAVYLESLFGFHRDPPYPVIRPLYDLGSPLDGARYTPKGGMACLYLAADPDTAFAELNQVYNKLRQQNPPVIVPVPPSVTFSANVELVRVLDLTDATVQVALGTDADELTGEWRISQANGIIPPTQTLGRAAFDYGPIEAMRYPSAQLHGHACYVLFTDRLDGSSYVEVIDSHGNLYERLPSV